MKYYTDIVIIFQVLVGSWPLWKIPVSDKWQTNSLTLYIYHVRPLPSGLGLDNALSPEFTVAAEHCDVLLTTTDGSRHTSTSYTY